MLAISSVWPLQSTERSKSLTGSLQWDCETICNSQDERGEVRLNKKVTVSCFLTDTSPDETNTGIVITERPSMEDLQLHTVSDVAPATTSVWAGEQVAACWNGLVKKDTKSTYKIQSIGYTPFGASK